mmetsp:Transcript_22589/g.57414  ORF Transcript_22589/g.57414 Transcript_22589/m.57414 type:complete len:1370 (-) Transcript_22589:1857-5966(-)
MATKVQAPLATGAIDLHQPAPTEPKLLRVLVVDSKSGSRTLVSSLLRECGYQVTAVKTSREAMQHLLPSHTGEEDERAAGPQQAVPVDLVIKEHEPPSADAGRLLRKMARNELLRRIPVVVMSSQDEREVVMNVLTLGAIDYLVKPLRHNELRHIWTRVWWWRRSGLSAPMHPGPQHTSGLRGARDMFGASYHSSSDSKETKCDEEEEPTSKEGSAPDGNNGSNGNGHGSNGSKDNGNGTSRVDAKPHAGANNGNGSSDNKNGHNGSNGNGASTTLAERNGANPLANTAEGRAPLGLVMGDTPPKAGAGRAFAQGGVAAQQPPVSSSRKRPAASALGHDGQGGNDQRRHHDDDQPQGHRELRAQQQGIAAAMAGPLSSSEREVLRGGTGMVVSGVGSGGGGSGGHSVPAQASNGGSGSGAAGLVGGVVTSTQPTSVVALVRSGLAAGGLGGPSAHNTSDDTLHAPTQRAQLMTSSAGPSNILRSGDNLAGSAFGDNNIPLYGAPQPSGAGAALNAGPNAAGHTFGAPSSSIASRGGSATVQGGTAGGAAGSVAANAQYAASLQASGGGGMHGHHLQRLPGWGAQGVRPLHPGGAHHGQGHVGSPAFPGLFPGPYGLPPHMMPQQLHPLALYAAAAAANAQGQAAHSSGGSGADNGGGASASVGPPMPPSMSPAGAGSPFFSPLGSISQEQLAAAAEAAAAAAAAGGLSHPGHPNHIMSQLMAAYAMAQGTNPAALAASQAGMAPNMQAAAAAAWMQHTAMMAAGTAARHGGAQGAHPLLQAAAQQQAGPQSSGAPNTNASAGGNPPNTSGPASQSMAGAGNVPTSAGMQMQLSMPMQGGMVMHGMQPGMSAPGMGMGITPGMMGMGPGGLPMVLPGVPEPRRRRALALDKYRMKRKNLKFSSAIRYENRKTMAQARPRIKGQFAKAGPAATPPLNEDGERADGDEDMDDADARMDEEDEGGMACDAGSRRARRGGRGEEEEYEEYDHGAEGDEGDDDDEDDEVARAPTTLPAGAGTSSRLRRMEVDAREQAEAREQSGPPRRGGGGGGDAQAAVVEEEDVVNSLRELREGRLFGSGLLGNKSGDNGDAPTSDARGVSGQRRGNSGSGMRGSVGRGGSSLSPNNGTGNGEPAAMVGSSGADVNGAVPPAVGGDGSGALAGSNSGAAGPVGANPSSSGGSGGGHAGSAPLPGHPAGIASNAAGAGGAAGAAAAQGSLTSQSGQNVSRGSHGRATHGGHGSQRTKGGSISGAAHDLAGGAGAVTAGQARDGMEPGGGRSGSHAREINARTATSHGTSHQHGSAAGSKGGEGKGEGNDGSGGNNKNGSDSGSNSPDENGGGRHGGGDKSMHQSTAQGPHGGGGRSHGGDHGHR